MAKASVQCSNESRTIFKDAALHLGCPQWEAVDRAARALKARLAGTRSAAEQAADIEAEMSGSEPASVRQVSDTTPTRVRQVSNTSAVAS